MTRQNDESNRELFYSPKLIANIHPFLHEFCKCQCQGDTSLIGILHICKTYICSLFITDVLLSVGQFYLNLVNMLCPEFVFTKAWGKYND